MREREIASEGSLIRKTRVGATFTVRGYQSQVPYIYMYVYRAGWMMLPLLSTKATFLSCLSDIYRLAGAFSLGGWYGG